MASKYRPSQFNYISRSYTSLYFSLQPHVDIKSYTFVGTNVNSGMKVQWVDYGGCKKDEWLGITWDWGVSTRDPWEFVCTFVTTDGESIVEKFYLYSIDSSTTSVGMTANPIKVKGRSLDVTFNSQMASFTDTVKSVTCMYSIAEADSTYGDNWSYVTRPSTSSSLYSFKKTLESLKPNTNYRIDACQKYIVGSASKECPSSIVTYFFTTGTDNLTISFNDGAKVKSATVFFNKDGKIKEVCEGYMNKDGVIKQLENS